MTDIDVLILREGMHILPVDAYAAALRQRLPDHTIRVADTPQEQSALVPRARVISSIFIDASTIEAADSLELFAGGAAGYNHLPLDTLAEHGVAVTNASGIHAPNIAEQVLAYILDFVRNLPVAREQQDKRVWRHYPSEELKGSTVTIVGLGAIGQAVAQRVAAFEVETIGVRYTPAKGGPTDSVIGFDDGDFYRALVDTDHLVIASPLTDTTRGLIDSTVFRTLPNHAYLVNVGRGKIVNTEDLVTALQQNQLGGVALDVTDPEPLPTDHELWKYDNVTITPHTSGYSPKMGDRLADIVAENVETLDAGGSTDDLRNLVQSRS